MKLRQVCALALPVLLFSGLGQIQAFPVYTLNDPTHGLSATASFTPVSGGFMMTVTNTEANTPDAAHAISQIQFTIGGSRMGQPTAFTQLSGTVTDFNGNTSSQTFTPSSPGQTTLAHWNFTNVSTSASGVFDVGPNGPGGQPNYLIVASGSKPNSSLTGTHIPSFVGPVNFFFADSSVPSDLNFSDITGVSFAFGTKPEFPLTPGDPGGGPGPGGGTPEPASLTLLGVSGGITLLTMAWRRRRNQGGGLSA